MWLPIEHPLVQAAKARASVTLVTVPGYPAQPWPLLPMRKWDDNSSQHLYWVDIQKNQ